MSATQSNEPQPGRRPGRPASTHRLAELVVHLTDCSADQAIAAVEAVQDVAPDDADEALQVVARAISSIRRIDLRDAVDLRDQAEEQTPIA